MSTMKIRWLGKKRPKIVDLPIGLSAIGEKYGEVLCDPVGEFPIAEGRKLLALPGASTLYVPENEYQKAHAPKPEAKADDGEEPGKPPVDSPKKKAQRERGRKLAALQAKKRAEKEAAAAGA